MDIVPDNTSEVFVDLLSLARARYPEVYTGICFMQISTFVISPLGLVGNLVILVAAYRLNDETSGRAFMQYLAASNCSGIVKDGLAYIVPLTLGFNTRSFNHATCKWSQYLGHVISIAGAHVLAAFSLDRLIALFFPFFYHARGKPAVATRVCVAVVALQLVVCAPIFAASSVERNRCNMNDFSVMRRDWVRLLTMFIRIQYAWVPIGIVVISNFLIAVKVLYKARNSLNKQTNGEGLEANSDDITKLLLATSVGYVSLTLAVTAQVAYTDTLIPASPAEKAYFDLFMVGKHYCLVVNQAFTVVYAATGKSFRAQIWRLCSCGH